MLKLSKKLSIFVSVSVTIFIHFLLIRSFNMLELDFLSQNQYMENQPHIGYIELWQVVFSMLLGYGTYIYTTSQQNRENNKLFVSYLLISATTILLPASFVQMILEENINTYLMHLPLFIFVLFLFYLYWRRYQYIISERNGYKLWLVISNDGLVNWHHIIDAKSQEEVELFLRNNLYLMQKKIISISAFSGGLNVLKFRNSKTRVIQSKHILCEK